MSTRNPPSYAVPAEIDRRMLNVYAAFIPPLISLTLYGVYLVLYGACILILVKRGNREHSQAHLFNCCIITLLFIVATLGLGCNTATFLIDAKYNLEIGLEVTTLYLTRQRFHHATQVVTVIANIVMDGILICRCYLIWNRRRKIILPLAFLCVTNNVVGILNVATTPIDDTFIMLSSVSDQWNLESSHLSTDSILLISFTAGSVFTNVLLTILIAGRIFYISRQVTGLIVACDPGLSGRKFHRTVISATLESGLLYPIVLILYVTFLLSSSRPVYLRNGAGMLVAMQPATLKAPLGPTILYSMLLPVAGIASTLIVVRIALGIAIHDEISFRETILADLGGGNDNELGSLDIRPLGSPGYTSDIESSAKSI